MTGCNEAAAGYLRCRQEGKTYVIIRKTKTESQGFTPSLSKQELMHNDSRRCAQTYVHCAILYKGNHGFHAPLPSRRLKRRQTLDHQHNGVTAYRDHREKGHYRQEGETDSDDGEKREKGEDYIGLQRITDSNGHSSPCNAVGEKRKKGVEGRGRE